MAIKQESFLNGANIDFIEGLYQRYLDDPASVDPSWRELFDAEHGGAPITVESAPKGTNGLFRALAASGRGSAQTGEDLVSTSVMKLQARVAQAVGAFRLRGHLIAKLDPLNRPRPVPDHYSDIGMVDPSYFTEAELEMRVDSLDVFDDKEVKLRDLLARLRRTYCETIGVEYMTLHDSNRRRWLMPRMEHSENRPRLSPQARKRILEHLSRAEGFETFLHTKYLGQKRFALEGGESLIPMLDALLQTAAPLGTKEVVVGMAHRGRLNVLTNIMGKTPELIFSEFNGPRDATGYLGRGDVKYHMGFSSDYPTESGESVHLSLSFNPSHLEAVNPVVEGRVRSKQDRRGGGDRRTRVVPVLIHGDAAFMGQGVVAETLNLSRLPGYETGGTIHIVINNQVGFTTDPEDSRSSTYCTAITNMLDVPVFHVNADDPEACVHVMQLATEYREKFKSDVVIDLICYRRWGHNEGDEPSWTQPHMYELIRARGGVRELYAQRLIEEGLLTEDEVEEIRQKTQDGYNEAHGRAAKNPNYSGPSFLQGLWENYLGGPDAEAPDVDTGVDKETLKDLLKKLAHLPEGFSAHRDVQRTVIKVRESVVVEDKPFHWSIAENLAYATVLAEGHPIRLSGQDTERGTFSHRHAVIHDVKTGDSYTALEHLSEDQGPFRLYNSPLSEFACLGFEYGYSLDTPDGLTVWEAQFGDFANNCQVVIDQFIASGEAKWNRLSGLVMLLPHGYEGAGPEHSSARLERFLELCANDNMQVAYPTTPAQIFHLLRRQVKRRWRKPLIVMTPKSLLRASWAMSTLDELATGRFQRVIGEAEDFDFGAAKRLYLCSGKVYYDLVKEREARKDTTTAIVRLEQLYPFPENTLRELLSRMPKLEKLAWVQEEPQNAGAWHFVLPRLLQLVSGRSGDRLNVDYIGRAAAASPATGLSKAHELETQLLLDTAFGKGS